MYKFQKFAKNFLSFALISGFGWLTDFLSFTILVKYFAMNAGYANFISSFVGVTFVWFISLKKVFKYSGSNQHSFLVVYWIYQIISISIFSQLIQLAVGICPEIFHLLNINFNPAIEAKIIITPFNLLTNFIFMSLLTQFMRKKR